MAKYFTIKELTASSTAKRLGIKNEPNKEQADNIIRLIETVLDPLREAYGGAIIVSSGYRSERLNRVVGGVKSSQHLSGEAADIKPKDGDVERLFNVAKDLINDGVIVVGQLLDEYNYSWVHISLPTERLHNQIKHISK